MWFKVESKRSSLGQKFVVRCNSEIAGSRVVEERPATGLRSKRCIMCELRQFTMVVDADMEACVDRL
jgi:hypothetical protein